MRPSRAGCRQSRGGSGGYRASLWTLEKVIGRQGLSLDDIVKILQITSSENPTFICIDALDEYLADHWVRLLNSSK